MSRDVVTAAEFYREVLGFEIVFETDWYVSMRHGDFELAVLAYDHPTVPADYRALPHGVIVNLEVDDVDALHARISADGRVINVQPLRDEAFGQRHFIVAGPDNVLVDVIQSIPPTEEFAAAYE